MFFNFRIISFSILFITFLGAVSTAQKVQPRPKQWLNEATLNDVHFVDHDIGFAVGDHGLILRTSDGGRHWHRVATSSHADLESVYFIDENTGWAVGGFSYAQINPKGAEKSWSPHHQGVVLKTTNGGNSWKPMRAESLPALKDIYFSDAKNGWAIGYGSHYYPSGVFVSTDGGQSWSGAPDQRLHDWKRLAAAPRGLMAIDDRSMIADITQQKPDNASMLVPRKVELNDLAFAGNIGVAVGREATVLMTNKQTWQFRETPIPKSFHLETIAAAGNKVWMAGTPGTYVFSYDVATGKWFRFNTGSRQSIKRICFVDEKRGWAVGTGGTILQTRDGGRTWQRKRGTDKRLGFMLVVDDNRSIPFEILAKYNAEEGFLSAVVWLESGTSTLSQQLAAKHACSQLGNNVFVKVDREHKKNQLGGTSDQHVKALAQLLRIHKPEIVIASGSTAGKVTSAVRAAADKQLYPKLIAENGLATWETARTLLLTHPKSNFDVSIGNSQFLVHSGKILADAVAHARAVMGEKNLTGRTLHLSSIMASSRVNRSANKLFESRNPTLQRASRVTGAFIAQMRKVVQKKKLIEQMMSWRAMVNGDNRSWTNQLQKLISQLDEDTAAIWLYELATKYWSNGDQNSAITSIENLISRYPNHWIANRSIVWLLNHQISGEAIYLVPQSTESKQVDNSVKKANFETRQKIETDIDGIQRIVWEPVKPGQSSRNDGPEVPIQVQRMEKAKRLIGLISGRNINFTNQPLVELSIASTRRKMENGLANTTVYRKLISSQTASPALQFIARRESQLSQSKPKIVPSTRTICQRLDTKPFLDGILDDTIWKTAQPNKIRINGTTSTEVMFSRDAKYLYVAIRAQKQSAMRYLPLNEQRKRDGDLDKRDRVVLRIDVDRDFQSYFEIALDHQGKVHDQLNGNTKWDPQIFVANQVGKKTWTIEAAIPLSELTAGVQSSDHWGISVERVSQNQSSSWPHRTDNRPFGLLHIQ